MTGKRKVWIAVLVLLLVLATGTGIYVSDYYHAEPAAAALAETGVQSDGRILVEVRESGAGLIFYPGGKVQPDGQTLFELREPRTGLIFYPGGKVQPEAYAPLLARLAEEGVLCVLIPMPGNLAVLAPNAAQGVAENFPEIEHWYIGGHSLGGAMAASYAAKHPEELEGLVLLAAYSTADLKDSGLSVLSVYGSEDGVMNRSAYEKDRANLPEDAEEVVIPGGCHAYFGNYGFQKGDGIPSVSPEEQQEQTAQAILSLIFG